MDYLSCSFLFNVIYRKGFAAQCGGDQLKLPVIGPATCEKASIFLRRRFKGDADVRSGSSPNSSRRDDGALGPQPRVFYRRGRGPQPARGACCRRAPDMLSMTVRATSADPHGGLVSCPVCISGTAHSSKGAPTSAKCRARRRKGERARADNRRSQCVRSSLEWCTSIWGRPICSMHCLPPTT